MWLLELRTNVVHPTAGQLWLPYVLVGVGDLCFLDYLL